jgi:hypothetical protein
LCTNALSAQDRSKPPERGAHWRETGARNSLTSNDTSARREARPPLKRFSAIVAYSQDGSALLAAGQPGAPGLDLLDACSLKPIRILRLDQRFLAHSRICCFVGLSPNAKTVFLAYAVSQAAKTTSSAGTLRRGSVEP